MAVWFEGHIEIACTIERVTQSLADHGAHYAGIVRLMPGLTDVELHEAGDTELTITTNEGVMKRTNIFTRVSEDGVTVEFDEDYRAGAVARVASHFLEEFTTSDAGVSHWLVISDLSAPGFAGLLYRMLAKSRTGNAFLSRHKEYLEAESDYALLGAPPVSEEP